MKCTPAIAPFAVAILLATGLCAIPFTQHAARAQTVDATQEGIGVGDTLPAAEVHIITSPGRYGLGPEPEGGKYAVAKGKLIRIDPESYKIQSILRAQSEVLD